ncbi:MAG: CHAD domain-containing protein [Elainellaceae cyanobacterium]
MAKNKKQRSEQAAPQPQSLGDYAHQVIQEQYQRIIDQEKLVLADQDPEALHQMRVGTRRLRTALQVFGMAVDLPKAASAKRLRDLARVLGAVRDLDVQLASLKEDYRSGLKKPEQKQLDKVSSALKQQRSKAVTTMKDVFEQPLYQALKSAFATWLKKPKYTAIAQLPISSTLPDLLAPLLSHVLLHPGWSIASEQINPKNSEMLHDLRKACKHARYQAEFFIPFYGKEFENWVKEVKQLQDQLGAFQDTQVLLDLLSKQLGQKFDMPDLQAAIDRQQTEALTNWNDIRQKYLDDGFRYHLHQMLLQPTLKLSQVHPELIEAHGRN